MIISYNWLLDYLPVRLSVTELSEILTSIGLEVEAAEISESVRGSLAGLVIGHVLTCEKHPNADKLSLTTVDIGSGTPLSIVCGAPNVAAGQKVVVAPVGTTVHPLRGEPFLIKSAKIRGQESQGMICAEDEIGLGDSHSGIIILPESAVPGTLAAAYYNIPEPDYAIHIGLTPNRSDANSHIGVARDVCAYLTYHRSGLFDVKMPTDAANQSVYEGDFKVIIEASEACYRYAGMSIRNVKVGPSPDWLKQRLNTLEIRSINNIVDVTNYVLHEFGQPLHAFDAQKLAGREIRIRFSEEGANFVCLDGQERKLSKEDLMICDAEKPVAIGGVFGGLDSGVSDATTEIFLESAYFNPKSIRRTSMRHGLRTDAATHFEKGVDINNVIPAMYRAAALIAQVSGGEIVPGCIDKYEVIVPNNQIVVSYDYIRSLSGKEYSESDVKTILLALGFEVVDQTPICLTVNVPTNKPDVLQPADIVEEILRIDGLDNIPISGRLNIALLPTAKDDRKLKEKIAAMLCGMGVQEIITNSVVNSKYYPGNENLVRMINSLSSELDVLRPSMTECGLEVISHNCNRRNNDLSLFEFGNVYEIGASGYKQEQRLAIWISGKCRQNNWETEATEASLFYLKGLVNNIAEYLNVTDWSMEISERRINIKRKNLNLGYLEPVSDARLKEFGIKQDVFVAELNWDAWVKATESSKISFKELARFPAVARDLALVIDVSVQYRDLADATNGLKLESLQSFDLFDVFESEKLGAGKKSYALNFVFQLSDRTLTDAEVEQMMSKLTVLYKEKFNAQIRE